MYPQSKYTRQKPAPIEQKSRKTGSHRDQNTETIPLPPPILSNEHGQKIQPGICQNLYFTGERASRTSSRRTATKPLRSFRKRKHRRNSNQSRFTPITTVPLEAISTAPDRSTSITERKNWSRLFTLLSATR